MCYRKTRLFALNVFNDGLETVMRFRLLEKTIIKQKYLQNDFKQMKFVDYYCVSSDKGW